MSQQTAQNNLFALDWHSLLTALLGDPDDDKRVRNKPDDRHPLPSSKVEHKIKCMVCDFGGNRYFNIRILELQILYIKNKHTYITNEYLDSKTKYSILKLIILLFKNKNLIYDIFITKIKNIHIFKADIYIFTTGIFLRNFFNIFLY